MKGAGQRRGAKTKFETASTNFQGVVTWKFYDLREFLKTIFKNVNLPTKAFLI